MARIVRFNPPTNVMVVRRLSDICTREALGADAKSLGMLVDVAKGDMRSCLNTLQVRRADSRCGVEVSTATRSSSKARARRSTRRRCARRSPGSRTAGLRRPWSGSASSSCTTTARAPRTVRPRRIARDYSADFGAADATTYVTRLAREVQNCGEYDKLAQGASFGYLVIAEVSMRAPRLL